MQNQVVPLSLRMSAFLLSTLGKPFPGLTARVFYRLYTTPPYRKLRETHLALKEQAVQEKVQVTRYPFDNRPLALAVYRWGQSDRKILLAHGWGGSPFDFKYMIAALVKAGYEVISFDAPAHGASEGKRTNLVQWMHIQEQLLQQTGPVHAVIGHSLGGLSAALTLVHKAVSVPRLVMISAAISAPVFFNETFEQFRIPQPVMPKVQQLISKRLQNDLQQLDLFRHINGIKAGQILVVYDENDHLAKAPQISAFVAQYPSIASLRINGEGHFRIMKNETVIARVLQFLESD